MGNDELAYRFSEEIYATKNDIKRALNTNLIEPIWDRVIKYRSSYEITLGFCDVYKKPFTLVFLPSIKKLIDDTESIVERFVEEHHNLTANSIENISFFNDILKHDLRLVAKSENIIVNDVALENIINNTNNNPDYAILERYTELYKNIVSSIFEDVDESNLLSFIETLYGEEKANLYRQKEITAYSQKVLINREFVAAPTKRIPEMMESGLAFINDKNNATIVSLAAISFLFNYIKPFENYNDLMAGSTIRALIKARFGFEASLLPVTSFLLEANDTLSQALKESSRGNNDFTYYLIEFCKALQSCCQYSLDKIVQVSSKEAQKAYFDKDNVAPSTEDVQHKQIENSSVTPIKEKKERRVDPVVSSKPVVNTSSYEDLDEKALKRAAQDLLESDPNLRPNQAKFYVRHCKLGKYYTIQQFKKFTGCVYETARTSMDNLARRGYYRREQIKNKFVYTPISKE